MNKIPVTHVGSLPRTQEVVDLIFARENGQPFDQTGSISAVDPRANAKCSMQPSAFARIAVLCPCHAPSAPRTGNRCNGGSGATERSHAG